MSADGPAPADGDARDRVRLDAALALTHTWFEHNSGWAPPEPETLEDWIADGVCRCPDECMVEPTGRCEHGLASWWLVLRALGDVEVPRLGEPGTGRGARRGLPPDR